MTIDQAIKNIATSELFDGFSYVFDDMYDADQAISHIKKLPCIIHVLPIGGTMTVRNGRIYDREEVAICFVGKVRRDANGDDHRQVFEAMKDAAMRFIAAMNESDDIGNVTVVSYGIMYNQLASIVTGVTLTFVAEGKGECLTTTQS